MSELFDGNDPMAMRKEFFYLTTEFEKNIEEGVQDDAIHFATKLRDIVRNNVKLNRSDKVRLLKTINRAKVRALLLGTSEGERIFRDLDYIGEDIVRLM